MSEQVHKTTPVSESDKQLDELYRKAFAIVLKLTHTLAIF